MKKIEQLKSQFVSMVSHELKAPIAVVYGFLNLITDEKILFFGGYDNDSFVCNDLFEFDMYDRSWKKHKINFKNLTFINK